MLFLKDLKLGFLPRLINKRIKPTNRKAKPDARYSSLILGIPLSDASEPPTARSITASKIQAIEQPIEYLVPKNLIL
jgi:hypothetical protein